MITKPFIGAIALLFTVLIISGGSPADSKSSPKPVALVLSVENVSNSSLRAYDHVYDGMQIDLRPAGVLKISYLATCLEETITGGRVKFQKEGRKLRKGAKSQSAETDCTTNQGNLEKEEKEAFDVVQALSPFQSEQWKERLIKTYQPIFQWPMGFDVASVTLKIHDLDRQDDLVVWQMESSNNHMVYPADAPPLQAGRPYRIEVAYAGGMSRTTVFSIDPGLQIPDSIANRLVPLEW